MNALDKLIAQREAAAPPPPAYKPDTKHWGKAVLLWTAKIALLLVALLGLGVGKVVGKKIAHRIMAAREWQETQPPAPRNWQRYTVGGVGLESPYPFGAEQDLLPTMPADFRPQVRSSRFFMNEGAPEGFAVTVSANEYIGPANAKGGADGAIRGAAVKMGDANPKVTSFSAGKDCYVARYRNPEINIDTMCWTHGNKAWAVSIFYTDIADADPASRVIASVKLVE